MNRLALTSLLVFAGASFGSADRLITIPIGRKIPLNQYRIESFSGLGHRSDQDRFLGFGLTDIFDIEVRNRLRTGEAATTFDFSANLVSPIVGITPGISFGVLDSLNQTVDGRRGYFALTFREYLETENDSLETDITLGYQIGSKNSGFVGLNIPLTRNLRIQAEHNGFRPSIALEYRFAKNVAVRYISQDQRGMIGFSWSGRL